MALKREMGSGLRQSQSRTICQVINDLGIILVFVLIQFGGHREHTEPDTGGFIFEQHQSSIRVQV